ncbi:hypothetical protein ERJ75_000221000 [Trypanosoma vivax]|nr:hypothetical protein ERJ75_000221000 [Trypanosoma vivax]
MMRWELGLVCNAVGSEGGRVAIRLALVTAGRCGEIALRLREGFVKHPGGRNTLTVDFGALQKSAQGGPGQSSALCVDCGRGGDQTQFGPENSDAAWEGRGTTGTVAQHRAAPGTLGRHFEQLREVDGPHVEDALGMAKLPRAPQKAVGEDRVPRPLFSGCGALGCARMARVAAVGRGFGDAAAGVGEAPPQHQGTAARCGAMCSGRRKSVHQNANRSREFWGRTPKKWGGPASFAKRRGNLRRFWWCLSIVVLAKASGLGRRFVAWPRVKASAAIMKPRRRYRMCRALWPLCFARSQLCLI